MAEILCVSSFQPYYGKCFLPRQSVCFSCLQPEAGNEGKMVAETSAITHAVIGSERFYTAIFLVFFQEKRLVVDVAAVKLLTK